MLWESWLDRLADAFGGATTIQTGVIVAFLCTMGLIVTAIIGVKGKQVGIVSGILAFVSVVFWSYIGWFPTQLGIIMAFVIALFVARELRDKF